MARVAKRGTAKRVQRSESNRVREALPSERGPCKMRGEEGAAEGGCQASKEWVRTAEREIGSESKGATTRTTRSKSKGATKWERAGGRESVGARDEGGERKGAREPESQRGAGPRRLRGAESAVERVGKSQPADTNRALVAFIRLGDSLQAPHPPIHRVTEAQGERGGRRGTWAQGRREGGA